MAMQGSLAAQLLFAALLGLLVLTFPCASAAGEDEKGELVAAASEKQKTNEEPLIEGMTFGGSLLQKLHPHSFYAAPFEEEFEDGWALEDDFSLHHGHHYPEQHGHYDEYDGNHDLRHGYTETITEHHHHVYEGEPKFDGGHHNADRHRSSRRSNIVNDSFPLLKPIFDVHKKRTSPITEHIIEKPHVSTSVGGSRAVRYKTPVVCCQDCPSGDLFCFAKCVRTGCIAKNTCAAAGQGVYAAFCKEECELGGFSLRAASITALPEKACRGYCAGDVQKMCTAHSCKDFGCFVRDCLSRAPAKCG